MPDQGTRGNEPTLGDWETRKEINNPFHSSLLLTPSMLKKRHGLICTWARLGRDGNIKRIFAFTEEIKIMYHTVLWVCRPGWQGHQARASSTPGSFSFFTVTHLLETITPGIANVELQAQKLEQLPQRLRQCENYWRNKILTQSESHQTKISVISNM